jgi:beta-galactosidase/beta-glucuronidase
MLKSLSATLLIVLLVSQIAVVADDWSPKKAPVMTRWAKDVSPAKVHPEYPRPQMVRENWVNLNGLWDYAIEDRGARGSRANEKDQVDARDPRAPQEWDGKILVPFPVESALSGVMKRVPDNGKLWYRRGFDIPNGLANDGRLLLHFGASDWETTVWVNGKKVGEHRGGYDPFSFDITDAVKRSPISPKSGSEKSSEAKSKDDKANKADFGEVGLPLNELVVAVSDPTDGSFQPRGKQVRKPNGIWYTPTTGIWQTVWLEPVPKTFVRSLKIETNYDAKTVRVIVGIGGNRTNLKSWELRMETGLGDGQRVGVGIGLENATEIAAVPPLSVQLPVLRSWTPATPFLYDIEVKLTCDGAVTDTITSYFAMRKISLGKDEQGVTRIMLNNKPVFQYGPLDQGFWPDGLYTAPTDEALRYDIEMTKKLGFNMIRKHVKAEPDRWYYHCDKLGMLVWQDMPSGDKHAAWDPFGKHDNTEATRSKESSENYNREWRAIIDSLRNHPSIVMWVPFNEGWGQANTVAVTKWTKEYDPTRLVNCASGGNDFPIGDVIDMHRYPGPFAPKPTSDRAAVLGEFGGLGLPLEGHTWQGKDNWGYRSFTAKDELQRAYVGLLSALRPMIAQGVSAAVYTQTTDVEIEVNGLMTYDREVLKFDADTIAKAARKLYLPPPKVTTIVPTSEQTAQTWRYTTDKPADGWQKPDFDASSWKSGPGGFGELSTPGSVVKTNWKTNDIWLRREFEFSSDKRIHELALRIHHDEDTEVFLNGELIAKTTGYTTQYLEIPLDQRAVELLKGGKNTLAVHCKQTGGGQYIDVGLVDLEEVAK